MAQVADPEHCKAAFQPTRPRTSAPKERVQSLATVYIEHVDHVMPPVRLPELPRPRFRETTSTSWIATSDCDQEDPQFVHTSPIQFGSALFTCAAATQTVTDEIQALQELSPGWNGYGADPINPEIIAAAKAVVAGWPTYLIGSPQVVPMTRGRLQLEWHRAGRSLELEFESPRKVHYLKWDSARRYSDESELPIEDRDKIKGLLAWFYGMTNV